MIHQYSNNVLLCSGFFYFYGYIYVIWMTLYLFTAGRTTTRYCRHTSNLSRQCKITTKSQTSHHPSKSVKFASNWVTSFTNTAPINVVLSSTRWVHGGGFWLMLFVQNSIVQKCCAKALNWRTKKYNEYLKHDSFWWFTENCNIGDMILWSV